MLTTCAAGVIEWSANPWRVLAETTLRLKPAFDSGFAGDVRPGEIIDILEQTILLNGRVRVRTNLGWLSWKSATGEPFIEQLPIDYGSISGLYPQTAAP